MPSPSRRPPRPNRPAPPAKPSLHPRNRHQGRYDFDALTKAYPDLSRFVVKNPSGEPTVDFASPDAVKALNRAILADAYGLATWDIPPGYLCPPIPGRADAIHHVADLLAESNGGVVPRGPSLRVLDVGVGANCVYPIIGHGEYGWRFLGSDIDAEAIASAKRIVEGHPTLATAVELRQQESSARILAGLLQPDEELDATLCNPPFHASLEEAQEGSRRKWRNLGRAPATKVAPALNFGGRNNELWTPGGESAFVRRMIAESARMPASCLWFTSLVSREATLPELLGALKQVHCAESRVLEMAQGQKRSRLLAWTFFDARGRAAWAARRWR